MAGADYYHCDLCGCKAFYDANLNYDYENCDPETYAPKLERVGAMKVLCDDCAKTHDVIIQAKGAEHGDS